MRWRFWAKTRLDRRELNSFESPRLFIEMLREADFAFINELLNTEGFLKFIGDRNVRSDDDAKAYISKTLKNRNILYWVVRLKGELAPVGIVSLVKRDSLPGRDIGFAFLPRYTGKGLAFEATSAALSRILPNYNDDVMFAITDSDNKPSIRLLEKFGFRQQKELEKDGKLSKVYEISTGILAAHIQAAGL